MSPRRPFSPYMGPDAESPAKPEPSAPLDVGARAPAESAYEAYWQSLRGHCELPPDKIAGWGTMPAYMRRAWAAAIAKGVEESQAAAPREQGALVAASKRVTLKDPHRASGVEALRDAGAAASGSPPTDVDRRLDEVRGRAEGATIGYGWTPHDVLEYAQEARDDRRFLLALVDELRRR